VICQYPQLPQLRFPDMSVDSGPNDQHEQQVDVNAERTATRLDDALARDPELGEPARRLTRSATDALGLAEDTLAHPGQDTQLDIDWIRQAVTDDVTCVAEDPDPLNRRPAADEAEWVANQSKTRARDLPGAWRQLQERNAGRVWQTMESLRTAVDGIGPWLKKTAKAAGQKIADYYRAAAPPNWTTDPAAAVIDYVGAVRLALDEGIPLAWVPDQETVTLLLAVPGTGVARRAHLYAILNARTVIILDYCEQRLRQIPTSPQTPSDRQRSVLFALQAVQALRANLPAAAQALATDLIDQLLHRAFMTIHGHYSHTSTPKRVESLAARHVRMGFTLLAMLREIATLMPVFKAMTAWRPESGTAPPTCFSRHVTAHHITASGQVTGVNALIAVMLAVSLMCQEHDTHWNNCRLERYMDEQRDILLAQSRRDVDS
jgi:hypothetical protein